MAEKRKNPITTISVYKSRKKLLERSARKASTDLDETIKVSDIINYMIDNMSGEAIRDIISIKLKEAQNAENYHRINR